MKKIFTQLNKLFILSILFCLVVSCSKEIEVINIPDVNFEKALIKLGLDKVQDGKLNVTDDIKGKKNLEIDSCNITDLSGLEVFEMLEVLEVSHNKLQKIDLAKNKKITKVNCASNELIILNISNNFDLIELDCSFNKLSTLDVTKNKSIKKLNVSHNNLTYLDISENYVLGNLNIAANKFKDFVVVYHPSLKELICSSNYELTKLLLIYTPALENLNCGSDSLLSALDVNDLEKLKKLDIRGTNIVELDIFQNHNLIELNTNYNIKDQYQLHNLVSLNRIANTNKTGNSEYDAFLWAIIIILIILIIVVITVSSPPDKQ